MTREEFYIGLEFTTGNGSRFRCTDVGTRVVVAIDLNGPEEVVQYDAKTQVETMRPVLPDERSTWHRGPPYAVSETVFDEYDLPGCEPLESKQSPMSAQPAAMRQAERQRAFEFVDAELRRLEVQFISFDGGVVTLTTHERAPHEHWHGEAESLYDSFADLEQSKLRRT